VERFGLHGVPRCNPGATERRRGRSGVAC
jgi:hypothetical protein